MLEAQSPYLTLCDVPLPSPSSLRRIRYLDIAHRGIGRGASHRTITVCNIGKITVRLIIYKSQV